MADVNRENIELHKQSKEVISLLDKMLESSSCTNDCQKIMKNVDEELVPEFTSSSYQSYDNDDDQFFRDFLLLWKSPRDEFIANYPNIERTTTNEKVVFTRDFIRKVVKKNEPTLRQLYLGECQSSFIYNKKDFLLNLWPLELTDMQTEITYYLMGLEADVMKRQIIPLGTFSKYVVYPEILTTLIMEKYQMSYADATNILNVGKLPI